MRVCFLTLDFYPFRSSGLAIYVEKTAAGLARRGHNVTVVASQRPKSEQVEDTPLPEPISVVRVPIGRLDWVGFGWQAARYLRSHSDDFDVIHFADVHFAYACRGSYVASAFQSFRQRLTSHHGRPYCKSRRDLVFRLAYYSVARWLMEGPAVRRARHILMSSRATKHEYTAHYGLASDRTSVVYPGIDVDRFSKRSERTEVTRRLGLASNMPTLLYVGFSTPRKGVEYLAEALSMMEIPAQLIMVGKWEDHYQESFIRRLGDACSRVYITGYVPDADLPDYFALADIFVFPTLLEGFGFPLVEAMAAGVPVVTTTGGSASEIVGEAGSIVPIGDSLKLAAALDRILTDQELARRLSQAGRARARALFDERRVPADIEAIYDRVGR